MYASRVPKFRRGDRKGALAPLQEHRPQQRRQDLQARTTRRPESRRAGGAQQQLGQLLCRGRHEQRWDHQLRRMAVRQAVEMDRPGVATAAILEVQRLEARRRLPLSSLRQLGSLPNQNSRTVVMFGVSCSRPPVDA
jgi:hypothetical protein